MTLVLLKKLRQSHQMKENVAVVAPCTSSSTQIPSQAGPQTKQAPPRASSKPLPQPNVHHLLRGVSIFGVIKVLYNCVLTMNFNIIINKIIFVNDVFKDIASWCG
jgi:hypothetical protein